MEVNLIFRKRLALIIPLLFTIFFPYVLEGNDSTKVHQFETFRGTRTVSGQSIELLRKSNMDFIVSHRFGSINDGIYELFGLDESNIRLGLDYGITDFLNIGLGRSSIQKTYDGFVKWRVKDQEHGGFPASINILGTIAAVGRRMEIDGVSFPFRTRLHYVLQVMAAKRFSEKLSAQITPTFIHKNLVELKENSNNLWSLGFTGRYRFTYSFAIIAEYYLNLNPNIGSEPNYNHLGIGIEIETKGHVFQINLTNSRSMADYQLITDTEGNWFNGDIHLGFNISRSFKVGKKRG